jgi:uncharacterized protein
MDWQNTPQSTNIEDRRGAGGGVSLGGGGAGGLGIGAILIIGLISYFTGIDPRLLIGGAQIVTGSGSGTGVGGGASVGQPVDANDPQLILMKHVLGDTEAVWTKVLPAQKNVRYTPATLVIYNGATDSGCGTAQAAMGPFYCPDDKKVYLDMAFFRDMQSKFGGGGDFAYAYVIAHEIGHHVQDLLGILGKVDDAKQSLSRTDANALSVRVELQADCLAGVWAANANQDLKLTQADVQQAIATAQAIGDDRLQTAARGYAVPDSFTHGSSAQRVQWLTTGLKSGQIDSCNTFAK